jgi:hypothetical protein
LGDDFEAGVDLIVFDDERWRETNDVGTRWDHEHAKFLAALNDGFSRSGEFEASEQAKASRLDNLFGKGLGNGRKAACQMLPCNATPLHEPSGCQLV